MRKDRQDELEMVYINFAKPLYYYLLKLTGSVHTAEELVQETFYRAILSLDLYENGQVKSWLFKVARNAYLTNSEDLISPYGVPDEALASREISEEVRDIMEMLPENYRTILYLREYEQFSYAELSTILDLSPAQVKVNLYRARQRFKQLAERLGKTLGEV